MVFFSVKLPDTPQSAEKDKITTDVTSGKPWRMLFIDFIDRELMHYATLSIILDIFPLISLNDIVSINEMYRSVWSQTHYGVADKN